MHLKALLSIRIFFLLFVLFPFKLLTASQHFLAPFASAQALSAANNRLAFDLYQEIQDEPSNQVFSPYSLTSAILSLYPAMDPATQEFARKYFSASEGIANWTDFLPLYLRSFNHFNQSTLNSPLFLFTGSTEQELSTAFTKKTALFFSDSSQDKKLRFAEKQLPLELQEKGLLLASSFFCQAKWPLPFSKYEGSMLQRTDYVPYLKTKSFEMIELVFDDQELGNERLCLYLFLPKHRLSQFHQQFHFKNFKRWLRSLAFLRRQIVLPSVEFTTKKDFAPLLKKTKLFPLFSEQANYQVLLSKERRFLQALWHESSFSLSEKGSFWRQKGSLGGASVQTSEFLERFELKKPFVFILFDKSAEMILLMGKCEVLSAKE